jgi:hypothetical protein
MQTYAVPATLYTQPTRGVVVLSGAASGSVDDALLTCTSALMLKFSYVPHGATS